MINKTFVSFLFYGLLFQKFKNVIYANQFCWNKRLTCPTKTEDLHAKYFKTTGILDYFGGWFPILQCGHLFHTSIKGISGYWKHFFLMI